MSAMRLTSVPRPSSSRVANVYISCLGVNVECQVSEVRSAADLRPSPYSSASAKSFDGCYQVTHEKYSIPIYNILLAFPVSEMQ